MPYLSQLIAGWHSSIRSMRLNGIQPLTQAMMLAQSKKGQPASGARILPTALLVSPTHLTLVMEVRHAVSITVLMEFVAKKSQ